MTMLSGYFMKRFSTARIASLILMLSAPTKAVEFNLNRQHLTDLGITNISLPRGDPGTLLALNGYHNDTLSMDEIYQKLNAKDYIPPDQLAIAQQFLENEIKGSGLYYLEQSIRGKFPGATTGQVLEKLRAAVGNNAVYQLLIFMRRDESPLAGGPAVERTAGETNRLMAILNNAVLAGKINAEDHRWATLLLQRTSPFDNLFKVELKHVETAVGQKYKAQPNIRSWQVSLGGWLGQYGYDKSFLEDVKDQARWNAMAKFDIDHATP
jgi:hypothetical protein